MAVAPNQQQRDAHGLLRETFARYGLNSVALATWALDSIIAGKSIQQILLELEERPEFKAAFPEIEARRQRSAETGIQLTPISPAEILEYRTQAKALMQSFGLPSSFYASNQDFFDLIVGDTSLSELNERLEISSRRVAFAPPEVRAVFNEMFGVASDDAMFAMFVDVERSLPSLEEEVQRAEAGGAARRFGFGLSAAEMADVANYNLGYDALVEGFGQLDLQRELFAETLYEEDFTVGREGVDAVVSRAGQERLKKRAEQRQAETAGAAGGAVENYGAVGLGTAEQT